MTDPTKYRFNTLGQKMTSQWGQIEKKIKFQNKGHFWNPEAKLDKKGMLQNENLMFGELTSFDLALTWSWPQVESDVKMNVSIEFFVQNDP